MKWIKKIFKKNNPIETSKLLNYLDALSIVNFEKNIDLAIKEILEYSFPLSLCNSSPRSILSIAYYLFESLVSKFKSSNFRIKNIKKDISFMCAYATIMRNNLPNGVDNRNKKEYNFKIVLNLTLNKTKELLIAKNQLYKNNYVKNWPHGLLYRLDDKLIRLKNAFEIMEKETIQFETVVDTLDDIIGYSILLFKTLKDIENEKAYF